MVCVEGAIETVGSVGLASTAEMAGSLFLLKSRIIESEGDYISGCDSESEIGCFDLSGSSLSVNDRRHSG